MSTDRFDPAGDSAASPTTSQGRELGAAPVDVTAQLPQGGATETVSREVVSLQDVRLFVLAQLEAAGVEVPAETAYEPHGPMNDAPAEEQLLLEL